MPDRRLAAIMFTDIVGYTRLMQESEMQANQLRQRHREICERCHLQYHGELVQYFGDGTLSIFGSCVDAVRCAVDMQRAFQEAPGVPLRIGIHLGDIAISDNDVFGDGVNIASRIESIGVPGAILISDEVRKQIKNQEIETVPMGRFDMKNVEAPVEVFAVKVSGIPLPDQEALKGGKGSLIGARPSDAQTWSRKARLGSIGLAAMVIAAFLFWVFRWNARFTGDRLSADIVEERVAAIPFENNTGDEKLDALGSLCSNMIINGLTEAGIKTCSPRIVQQYSHLIGVLPGNSEGKPAFSEVVGARYWIEGYFLQEGDSLTVKSYLTDGQTGSLVRNFPDIKGDVREKEKLVDELTRRIMGYWVAKDRIAEGNFKPPLYEAYQVFQKTYEEMAGIWTTRDLQLKYSRKAFDMDSTFYLAALTEMYWLAGAGNPRADTLISLLGPHYEKMTKFEQAFYNANKAINERNWPAYSHFMAEKYRIFPKDESNKDYAFQLAIRENRPEKGWLVMNDLNPAYIPDEWTGWKANWVVYTAWYGLRAGKYPEVIKMIDTYLKNDDSPPIKGTYFLFKSLALLRSNQTGKVFAMIDEVSQIESASIWLKDEYDLVVFCNRAAEELLISGNKADAHKFLDIALKWALEIPERMSRLRDSLDLAETYRLKGQPEKALDLEAPFKVHFVNRSNAFGFWESLLYESGIGIDYALLGEKKKAEEIIRDLLNRDQLDPAFRFYCVARVYAVLGEKEKAMEYINATKITGNNPLAFERDYYMKKLYGYPPYEDYLKKRD